MFEWDVGEAAETVASDLEGMHGDEMDMESETEELQEEMAVEAEEREAFSPFVPADHSPPENAFRVLPCPVTLPHDLTPGQLIATWVGEGYFSWYYI